MVVKDRLKGFITEHSGMSVRQFEKRFGYSNGSLMKAKGVTLEKMVEIIGAYPELNLEWLFKGEGEMIKKLDVGNLPAAPTIRGNDGIKAYIFDSNEIQRVEIVLKEKV